MRMVDAIAATVIETRLDETIDSDTRQLILKDMPSTLDWERKVYRGFLLRKTLGSPLFRLIAIISCRYWQLTESQQFLASKVEYQRTA